MKKYLTVALITSIIMLAVMGTAVFMLSKSQTTQEDIEMVKQQEEMDVVTDKKESVNDNDSTVLYRTGTNQNVETFSFQNNQAIYNVSKSEQVKDKLDKLKRKRDYTFSSPLWAYNPFGTNVLSMYVYFKNSEPTYLKYTISVEDAAIPDFTRTLYNGESSNLTRKHEYQLVGLIPNMENYIVLKLYNERNQLLNKVTYKIDLADISTKAPIKLATTTGNSKTQLSNGLFYVLGLNNSSKQKECANYLYDNSGVLRGIIPLTNDQSDSIGLIEGKMIYDYGVNKLAEVTPLGQVTKIYDLGKYRKHHDFVYDGFGHLLVLATDPSKQSKSVEDLVLSVDMKTGKVKKIIDMEKLLPQIKKKAKKPKGSKSLNWVGLNSIAIAGTNDILLSSSELSSVFRINQINSEKPEVAYIIAEQTIWKGTNYKDKVLEKVVIDENEGYNAQFGQTSVQYELDTTLSEGQYYISLFNNNYGNSPTRPKYDWKKFAGIGTKNHTADHSMFYKYLIDETAGSYELIKDIQVPYSSTLGSVLNYQGNHIINSGKAAIYGEYDVSGKLIKQYKGNTKSDINDVYKYDMKGFWFQ
jgi:hypothetical protein